MNEKLVLAGLVAATKWSIDLETVEIRFASNELQVLSQTPTSDLMGILEEMIEHDIVVRIPPKRSYALNLEVKSIKKAEPKIVGM